MCLYVKKNIITTAEKDITCYKLLIRMNFRGEFRYCTPFRNYPIKLGERVFANGYEDIGQRIKVKKTFMYVVGGGFIHTFASIQGIKSFWKRWLGQYLLDLSDLDLVVVKCLIPKGAQYYKGTFEWTGLSSYASTELIYGDDIIDPRTL